MTELEQVVARFVKVGGYLVHPSQIAREIPGGVELTDGRTITESENA